MKRLSLTLVSLLALASAVHADPYVRAGVGLIKPDIKPNFTQRYFDSESLESTGAISLAFGYELSEPKGVAVEGEFLYFTAENSVTVANTDSRATAAWNAFYNPDVALPAGNYSFGQEFSAPFLIVNLVLNHDLGEDSRFGWNAGMGIGTAFLSQEIFVNAPNTANSRSQSEDELALTLQLKGALRYEITDSISIIGGLRALYIYRPRWIFEEVAIEGDSGGAIGADLAIRWTFGGARQ